MPFLMFIWETFCQDLSKIIHLPQLRKRMSKLHVMNKNYVTHELVPPRGTGTTTLPHLEHCVPEISKVFFQISIAQSNVKKSFQLPRLRSIVPINLFWQHLFKEPEFLVNSFTLKPKALKSLIMCCINNIQYVLTRNLTKYLHHADYSVVFDDNHKTIKQTRAKVCCK